MGSGKKFLSLANSLTIDNAFELVSNIAENECVGSAKPLVKWKSSRHQVLFESENHFYKIYEQSSHGAGPFFSLLRNELAKAYSELGIEWNVVSFERDGKIYDFEQRQKLKVATEEDGPFSEIFISFSGLLEKVEERLEFGSILSQLKKRDEFRNLVAIKILRNCINKHEDYAIFNGQAILLDDAEFFIAMAFDSGDERAFDCFKSIPIDVSYGNFSFANAMQWQKCGSELEEENSVNEWYLILNEQNEANGRVMEPVNCKLSSLSHNNLKTNIECVDVFAHASLQDEGGSECRRIVIETDLQQDDEEELYRKLSAMEQAPMAGNLELSSAGVCVVTSWQPCVKKCWEWHMKTISAYFPWVNKETRIALTKHFCEEFLEGNFSREDFCGRYKTEIVFKASAEQDKPDVKLFLKFLTVLARSDPKAYKAQLLKSNGDGPSASGFSEGMREKILQVGRCAGLC